MYLDCFKNCNKPYLRVVHNFYVTNNGKNKQQRVTIKNLGPLSNYDDGKPDLLIRLRGKFKQGKLVDLDELENELDKKAPKKRKIHIDRDKINFDLNPKNIGYFFLNALYCRLGINEILNRIKSDSRIKYDLNGIVKLLVFGRVLNPKSKKRTFEEQRNEYFFPIVQTDNLEEVYRTLDVLAENSEKIQNRMNTKIKNSSIGRKTDLIYYDVTNYYFETMYGDDDVYELDENNEIVKDDKGNPIIVKKGFKKKGVSKENKNTPIVQMGLFIDNNGIPISHKLFPGNTQDKTTFKNVLENDVKKLNLGRVVAVADNGMNTQENKYLLTEQENGYIVSKSVKRSWTSQRKWALEEDGYTCITNGLGEVVFKYKSRINEITLTYKNTDGTKSKKKVQEKEIIYWSKKHYEKELHQNKKFIEYLESCKEHPDKLKDRERKSQQFIKTVDVDKKTGEVIHPEKVIIFLDKKLEKYKETMGFYSIVTSEIKTDDKEIINRYHGLSRIEDSFRIIKSDLEGRPIHVWTEEHIKAHFLVCFIALTIIRILQYKILKKENKSTLNVDGWEQGLTAEKIKETLKKFQADQIYEDGYKISKINEEMDKLLKSNDINFRFKDYTFKEIKELKRQINDIGI